MSISSRKTPDPFARVSKTILDDDRISWRAKGIAAYLVGKPDGWKLRVTDLVKHGTDGKHAIRAALNELREFGYAEYTQSHVDGRLQEGHWEVSDKPIYPPRSKNRNAVISRSENQDAVPQVSEDQHHSKNDSNEIDYKEKEGLCLSEAQNNPLKTHSPTPNHGARPLPQLPESLEHLTAAWARWQQYCREIGKPLIRTQAEEQIELMEAMTDTEVYDAMKAAMRARWSTFYKPKKNEPTKRQEPPGVNL